MKKAFGALALTLALASGAWADSYVVATDNTRVYSGPDVKSVVKGVVLKGRVMEGTVQKNDWVMIPFGAQPGYVLKSDLQKPGTIQKAELKKTDQIKVPETTAQKTNTKPAPLQAKTIEKTESRPVQAQAPKKITQTAESKLVQNKIAKNEAYPAKGAVAQKQEVNIVSVPVAEKKEVPEAPKMVPLDELQKAETERDRISQKLTAAMEQNRKLQDEVKRLQTALEIGGNDQFIAVGDHGDMVFLKGVGEVQMATAFGKTVVKVDRKRSSRADSLFSAVLADRIPYKDSIYYVCDTRTLQFNGS